MAIIHESLSIPSRNIYVVSTLSYPSDVTHNCIWPNRKPSGPREDHCPQSCPLSKFQPIYPVRSQRFWRITDSHIFSFLMTKIDERLSRLFNLILSVYKRYTRQCSGSLLLFFTKNPLIIKNIRLFLMNASNRHLTPLIPFTFSTPTPR